MKHFQPSNKIITRRDFLKKSSLLATLAILETFAPAYAWEKNGNTVATKISDGNDDIYDFLIERKSLNINGRDTSAVTLNGTIPGPLVRLQEGRNAVMRVTNKLEEDTSIHWHGLLVPSDMDGVPGLSFPGIKPGETFTYRFPVKQAGTYWYHSHSGLQEQLGHYAPIIIDPADKEPYEYDRDYIVVLSDWTFHDPETVFAKLKKHEGYYNYQKRTVADFFNDIQTMGWGPAWQKANMWGQMRMNPRDLLDITGAEYVYLMNGLAANSNWTGLFNKGEKIRLRFINSSAMTFFDVRIPGLKMTVIQADGQPIQPVTVDEFRIGNAETYDVIVEPAGNDAYTIFAESMDRSGYVRGTLALQEGMTAQIPAMRKMPERDMKSMGMNHDMSNMGHDMGAMNHDMSSMGHDMSAMNHDMNNMPMTTSTTAMHGPDHHGPGADMIVMQPLDRMDDPGVGLQNTAQHRVLVYRDLKALKPWPDQRPADREMELHLTGHMERYMWSFDGKKFSEVTGPILFNYGERLRLSLVNDTMMDHPIHLHGMWLEMENGNGELRPRKHTIIVKPGEKISALISVDAKGNWAFHCHLMYHMKAGMFRVVRVA